MGQIVVGYDGSDCGKAALTRVCGLAKGLGDSVVVVFGYAPPGLWGGEIVEHEDAIEELGQKLMEEAKSHVGLERHRHRVRRWSPRSPPRRWSRWPTSAMRG